MNTALLIANSTNTAIVTVPHLGNAQGKTVDGNVVRCRAGEGRVQPQCDDDQHSTATLAREFESCLPSSSLVSAQEWSTHHAPLNLRWACETVAPRWPSRAMPISDGIGLLTCSTSWDGPAAMAGGRAFPQPTSLDKKSGSALCFGARSVVCDVKYLCRVLASPPACDLLTSARAVGS